MFVKIEGVYYNKNTIRSFSLQEPIVNGRPVFDIHITLDNRNEMTARYQTEFARDVILTQLLGED